MRERGAQQSDVLRAVATAMVAAPVGDRWRRDGVDRDGDDLTVVCALCDGVVVVTVC